MGLTWSYPGVAVAIVPVSRPVLPQCLKKLVFTAADFSIFMEATCVLISVNTLEMTGLNQNLMASSVLARRGCLFSSS